MYAPPFTVSAKAINLIAEFSAWLERFVILIRQEELSGLVGIAKKNIFNNMKKLRKQVCLFDTELIKTVGVKS